MDSERFSRLVDESLEALPHEFKKHLRNVAIIVEPEPSAELLERAGIPPDETLLGFYEGTPLPERGVEAPLHPDCIWIFQGPIEDVCSTDEEIRIEVRVTVMHEIAHFFGMDDDELEAIGY